MDGARETKGRPVRHEPRPRLTKMVNGVDRARRGEEERKRKGSRQGKGDDEGTRATIFLQPLKLPEQAVT